MLASLPYAEFVGSADPLTLLATTPDRIAKLVQGWDTKRWSMTYAPGSWTASQLVLHLAQDEIGWCNRIRLAATVDPYVVQVYDGAEWVILESPTDPEIALNAYLALRRLNLILFKRIPRDRRMQLFPHSELGEISIDWIIQTLAGHDLHHLRHLEKIAAP